MAVVVPEAAKTDVPIVSRAIAPATPTPIVRPGTARMIHPFGTRCIRLARAQSREHLDT